ncbi:MAG: hypothetical protein IIT41_03945 [Oscillospiraceae bacterium]|nr:hypothetical protein [Oscillospiraceae bacterium]MBQ5568379.1 hypothetical protein [Oscillospiraceae bacterium]
MSLDLGIGFQAAEALWSAALGALLGALYDIFRAVRRRRPSAALSFILDAAFWLIAGICLFLISFAVGGGKMRVFMTLAAGIGAVLYFFALSPAVLYIFDFFIGGVDRLLEFIAFPLKKIRIFVKKLFSSLKERYKIIKSGRMAQASMQDGKGGRPFETEAHRYFYEGHHSGPSSVRGDDSHRASRKNRDRGRNAGRETKDPR